MTFSQVKLYEAQFESCFVPGLQLGVLSQHAKSQENQSENLRHDEAELVDVHSIVNASPQDLGMLIVLLTWDKSAHCVYTFVDKREIVEHGLGP